MLSATEVALGICVAVGVLGAGMGIAALILRRGRRCPSCGAELAPVLDAAPPSERTWEAFACPSCNTAVTLAGGQRARFAWCPSCRQRTLETTCHRLADEEGAAVVEVHERCTLCGHDATVVVGRRSGRRGIVLAFPAEPRRRDGSP